MRRSPVIRLAAFLAAASAVSAQTLPASDPYRQWALSKWTEATVANESLRGSVWGETANPDGDQLLNLQEYVFDTDPKVRTTTDPVSWSNTVSPGHFTLTCRVRQNDPGLLVLPQVSTRLQDWQPAAPSSVSSWAGSLAGHFTEISRTPVAGNYATITWRCARSVFESPAQFTRLLVMRGSASAVISPTDGLRFHETAAPAGGQAVESGTIIPSGFSGTISIPITVPPGTAGMEPKLAITYSSQAPNGLLGVGFSISGLSAIGRSGPTQWHDGKRGGVSLTENPTTNESADRFTLDGQRLVITSGTWGTPGSTYRILSPASPPSATPMLARSHGRSKPKPGSPTNTGPPPTPAPRPAAPASPETMPCSPGP